MFPSPFIVPRISGKIGKMDDLSKFLGFLYEQEEGYVYVATKGQLNAETLTAPWESHFFVWPVDAEKVHDFITLQGSYTDVDVYIAPALFKAKNALKKTVKGSNVVWVEFDGQEQIDFGDLPRPDCIVQTSSDTHLHCYWKVPFIDSVDELDSINRRLMYYLEADASGFDAGQVLRPPLSKNWKYDKEVGQEVVLAHFEPSPTKFDYSAFDAAPEVKTKVVLLNSTMLLEPMKLLQELPLGAKLKKKIISETVSVESKARSSFLMRIGYELAEEGCNHIQIVSLLSHVDDRVKKFVGRSDRLTRLSEIASRALLAIDIEEGITLYSPMEIVNYKEDLDWLIPGLLHRKGFMILTGPPGVGKTTLALQLLKHLATGEKFFLLDTVPDCRSLVMSLEMSIVELKYTMTHHFKEYEANPQWNDCVRITDDNATLLDYEALIEEYQPHVVLIDSMSELATQELNEGESRAITRWIKKVRRKYNCAFIVIHHNRKDQGNGSKGKRPVKLTDLYGSYIFGKDIDSALNLERDDNDNNVIELYSLKTRFGTKIEFPLEQNENLVFSLRTKTDDSGPVGPVKLGNLNFQLSDVTSSN